MHLAVLFNKRCDRIIDGYHLKFTIGMPILRTPFRTYTLLGQSPGYPLPSKFQDQAEYKTGNSIPNTMPENGSHYQSDYYKFPYGQRSKETTDSKESFFVHRWEDNGSKRKSYFDQTFQ